MTNWFHSIDFQPPRLRAPSFAFSLLELLVVIAIIAMMVGLSAVAVQGFRAPAVQQAAEQAMSGMSLARQIAVTKNTQAAFLIANQTNGAFPSEPFRHWAVIFSNRSANTWSFAKNWEPLPPGAIFLETFGQTGNAYAPVGGNPLSTSYGVGNVVPSRFALGNFTIGSSNLSIPRIAFSSDGSVNGSGIAVRIAQGTILGGNATLLSTNQYFIVESDSRNGRIRMRSPQSYRSP
jgi:Tfp pilus assembly protein FimT